MLLRLRRRLLVALLLPLSLRCRGRLLLLLLLLVLLLGLLALLAPPAAALLAAANRRSLQLSQERRHGCIRLLLPLPQLLLTCRLLLLRRGAARRAGAAFLALAHALPLLQAPQRLCRTRVALLERRLRVGQQWGGCGCKLKREVWLRGEPERAAGMRS